MAYPTLYRKRIMPEECIHLKDDMIVEWNDDRIITKWNALKPKKDLHHGYSCYFLKEGFKISKFLREDNSLLYWYCDIVEYQYENKKAATEENPESALISLDLLADVIIYPDGFVKVVDLDELAAALEKGALDSCLLQKCLLRLNHLLQIIYEGNFPQLQKYIEDIALS